MVFLEGMSDNPNHVVIGFRHVFFFKQTKKTQQNKKTIPQMNSLHLSLKKKKDFVACVPWYCKWRLVPISELGLGSLPDFSILLQMCR